MASGDFLFSFFPSDNVPPTTLYATRSTFAGATGLRDILLFDGVAQNETAIFEEFWPPQYAGGGVDFEIDYSTDGVSLGAIEFEVSIEVIQDADDQDAGGQDFGTATNAADTPSTATININDQMTAGSISHANCGSPSPRDRMRVKVTRDYDHASNTDDVQFHGIYFTET